MWTYYKLWGRDENEDTENNSNIQYIIKSLHLFLLSIRIPHVRVLPNRFSKSYLNRLAVVIAPQLLHRNSSAVAML